MKLFHLSECYLYHVSRQKCPALIVEHLGCLTVNKQEVQSQPVFVCISFLCSHYCGHP